MQVNLIEQKNHKQYEKQNFRNIWFNKATNWSEKVVYEILKE